MQKQYALPLVALQFCRENKMLAMAYRKSYSSMALLTFIRTESKLKFLSVGTLIIFTLALV